MTIDPDEADRPDPVQPPEYADPAKFPSFDDVDSTTVELPDDSFDPSAADLESEH
ncbi:hypothetical protein [Actinoplanes sp. N902-109]|uniref:hypothetical protein n=1 Tax=Actinoplanes sp. (strain N902-109) TaxID=649831 RepID=UPI00032949D0|nr:hypothetical protein [Actinoplanes sp. N902-109]AGL19490.1 hypothetical protein L083_5980 [Actinoplanes sp. N902-109]